MAIPFLAQTIFKDNVKLVFGDGSDLQIYHDGSSSRIGDAGTGDLVISGTNLQLTDTATGESFFKGTSNGAVQLYYNGGEKFITTNTGIDVTGTVNLDNLTINGAQGSNGQVLTSTGSGIAWENASGGASLSGGEASKVAVWSATDTLTHNDNFHFDTTNVRLGIGDSNPNRTLVVSETRTDSTASDAYTSIVKSVQASGLSTNPGTGGLKVQYTSSSSNVHAFGLVAGSSSSDFLTTGPMHFYTNSDLDTVSATGFAMQLDASQRLILGSMTASQKLNVSGNVLASRYYSTPSSGNYSTQYYIDPNDGTTSAVLNGDVAIGDFSTPAHRLVVRTPGGESGNTEDGVFIKSPFAGGSPMTTDAQPFLSIGCRNTSGGVSRIFLGQNATATSQESLVEYSRDNGTLGVFVKGMGTYREHVRFGNQSSGTARTRFYGNVGIGTNPSSTLHVAGTARATDGVTTDGSAKFYTWRALNNTANSSNQYYKIARITSSQSSRFIIELAGRSTSYGDTSLPAFGKIVGQLNNDNNYDIVYYNASATDEVVDEVGQVDVSTTATDIYVRVGTYAELTATAHISDGTIVTYGGVSGSTSTPTNYVQATEYKLWNTGNDGASSGLDADLLDGQHASEFAASSHTHAASDVTSGTFATARIPNLAASKITSGTFNAARIAHNSFDIGDTTAETGRSVHETGIYTFNRNNGTLGTGTESAYYSVLAWGQGTGGSAQIAAKWTSGGDKLYYRSLRDTTDNWWNWKEIWHSGNDGSGTGLDADLLDGLQTTSSGDRWGVVPTVSTSGVLEAGKYIDFHESDGTTSDYNYRITSTSGRLYFSGDIEVDGGDIYINDGNTRLTEGSNNALRMQTNSGYVDIGAQNSSYSHFSTDRPVFYFNKGLTVDSGVVRSYDENLELNRAGSSTARIRITSGTTISDQNFDVGSYHSLDNNGQFILGDPGGIQSGISLRCDTSDITVETSAGLTLATLGNSGNVFGGSVKSPIYYDSSGTTYYLDLGNTGDSLRTAGDVVAYYSSDKRYKENIKPIESPIEKVKAISGITFEWNEKSHKETGKKDIGVIAQEVEEVLPEIVQTRDNGYKAVDYQKLTAVLIEAIKDQQKQIDELKSIINGGS